MPNLAELMRQKLKEQEEKITPEQKKIISKEERLNEIEELKKLVNIHEIFFKKQYEYDKSLIMKRFEKLEREIEKLKSKENTI